MKIYPGENVSGQVSNETRRERTAIPSSPRSRPVSPAEQMDRPIPELRKQLLVVQRALGRYQRILGGFEGFKVLLDTEAKRATDYIHHVQYRGEAVLKPYGDRLEAILQTGDRTGLQQLIDATKTEIRGLAVELSRLETAEQNSRSLASGNIVPAGILAGIRSEGSRLLTLEGRNVLDLLR